MKETIGTVAVAILAVSAVTARAMYVPLNSLTITSLYTNRTESETDAPSPRFDGDGEYHGEAKGVRSSGDQVQMYDASSVVAAEWFDSAEAGRASREGYRQRQKRGYPKVSL